MTVQSNGTGPSGRRAKRYWGSEGDLGDPRLDVPVNAAISGVSEVERTRTVATYTSGCRSPASRRSFPCASPQHCGVCCAWRGYGSARSPFDADRVVVRVALCRRRLVCPLIEVPPDRIVRLHASLAAVQ